MRAKRYITLLVASVALISATWAIVRAAEKTEEQSPLSGGRWGGQNMLRGLQGVSVNVDVMHPDAADELGLAREDLIADTELQLRQHGIKVLSHAPGTAVLYINADLLLGDDSPRVACSVQVKLCQDVLLARDPAIHCGAITWWTRQLRTVGRDNLQRVRHDVKIDVANFINAYLAANPEQAPTEGEPEKDKPSL
jgi:hypothetical protein